MPIAQAAEAFTAAVARREALLASGFDPDQSLIEKIRPRLGSLDQILGAHGYARSGFGNAARYRHSSSQSGAFGANVRVFGDVERVYSHNAGDPLHSGNLPTWCNGVTAVDAFDATAILDFGGDRKLALQQLAESFGLSKREENRAVARRIHQLIRSRASQAVIEAAAYAEGERLGLTRDDVVRVTIWVAAKFERGRAA